MKWNLKLVSLGSLVILCPMLLGFTLWDKLPQKIPIHFNFSGQIDGYLSKVEFVVYLPLIMLAVHLFSLFVTTQDPKRRHISPKIFPLLYFLVPMVSLVMTGGIYGYMFGWLTSPSRYIIAIVSFVFILIGNYLPKVKQNYTVGIKLPWTLNDEENWDKTHRLAGRLWVIGGLFMLALALVFERGLYLVLPLLIILTLVPSLYSYVLYQKKQQLNND